MPLRRLSSVGQTGGAQISRKKDSSDTWQDEASYFLKDALGSIATILDEEGERTHRQGFEPFGQSRSPQFSDDGVRIGFTGHAHDSIIGLIDMKGRICDPQLGRFLSADPIV